MSNPGHVEWPDPNAAPLDERYAKTHAVLAVFDDLTARIAMLEAAVAVYDRLGVELVAQLKALKIRVDDLEAGEKRLRAAVDALQLRNLGKNAE